MNYWRRWIARIKKKTGSLSLAEMGAYDRLLDEYYSEEKPLPGDLERCCRIAGALRPEEVEVVRFVLAKFFVLTPEGYAQATADEELSIAQPAIQAARVNGSKGGRPKGSGKKKPTQKPTGLPQKNPAGSPPATQAETTDQPTLLPTVESRGGEGVADAPPPSPPVADATVHPSHPARASAKKPAVTPELPDWVPAQEWADFIEHRRAMKKVPFTDAAKAGVLRELAKLRAQGHDPAELLTTAVVRGWRTVFPPQPGASAGRPFVGKQSAIEAANKRAGAAWLASQEAADAKR